MEYIFILAALFWGFVVYPYITASILVFGIIFVIYNDKETQKKKRKNNQINSMKMNVIYDNISEVKSLIESNFDGQICSRCLENDYEVQNFNSNFSSVHIKCNMCSKKSWIKSLNSKISKKIEKHMDNATSQGGGYFYNSQTNDFTWKQYDVFYPDNVTFKENLKSKNEKNIIERTREPIPDSVKNRVWRRDEGMCVKCNSNENLEFDHIIPHSKGGSNTYRNLQLLCESCNRSKSAKI